MMMMMMMMMMMNKLDSVFSFTEEKEIENGMGRRGRDDGADK